MFTTICVVSILNRHPCLCCLSLPIHFKFSTIFFHLILVLACTFLGILPPNHLQYPFFFLLWYSPGHCFSPSHLVMSIFSSSSCIFFNLPFSFPSEPPVVINWFYNIGVTVHVLGSLSFNPVSSTVSIKSDTDWCSYANLKSVNYSSLLFLLSVDFSVIPVLQLKEPKLLSFCCTMRGFPSRQGMFCSVAASAPVAERSAKLKRLTGSTRLKFIE